MTQEISNQLSEQDLENIENHENRGLVARFLDKASEVVSNNPNVSRVVMGVVASVVSAPFSGPAAVVVGAVAALASEGLVNAAEKRHEDTLKRKASVKRRDALRLHQQEHQQEKSAEKSDKLNDLQKPGEPSHDVLDPEGAPLDQTKQAEIGSR